MATYFGTNSNDTYNGTSADDLIFGYEGNDTLRGGNGSDQIEGGGGNDNLRGNAGNDTLKGDAGDDTLQGGTGADTIEGGNGADTYLFAKGDGMDTLLNSDTDGGKDVVKFTNTASTEIMELSISGTSLILSYGASDSISIINYFRLAGGGIIDVFPYPDYRIDEFQFSDGVVWTWDNIKTKIQGFIEGTESDDVLDGYAGVNNIIYGLGGTDFITGGSGDDIIIGGKGDDYWSLDDSKFGLLLDESGGADTYLFAKGDGRDEIYNFDTDGSKDVVRFTDVTSNEVTEVRRVSVYGDDLKLSYGTSDSIIIDNYFSYADYRIDEFQFSDGVVWTWDDIKTKVLQGTAGNDRLQGYDGEANTISGLAGNDILLGGNGNDKLNGGTGTDAMTGGAGNDNYTVDNIGDSITELASEGTDTVTSSINWVLGANLERLNLSGTKIINGSGNSLNNTINGNAAANTLSGDAGSDSLKGGNGMDVLVGGIGKDKLYLAETTAVTDTVKIATGDSQSNGYDVVANFALGNGVTNTAADRLDLDTTLISANAAAVNGADSGLIKSHSISNGLISFDDVDSFAANLVLSASNLTDVFGYLQNNINSGNTVAFNAVGNTYLFQDGGLIDTVVQLTGVTASNINTTGLVADGVWLV